MMAATEPTPVDEWPHLLATVQASRKFARLLDCLGLQPATQWPGRTAHRLDTGELDALAAEVDTQAIGRRGPGSGADVGARRRTVFLSYRREVSWAMAHLVRNELEQRGFNVFMDVIDIDNGQFEPTILSEIQNRKHFLILLEPGSLDRIRDPDDWLCREIAHALQHRRNVVPLLANGAQMPRAMDLPEEIASLSSFNAVPVPHDYFLEAMARLCNRFIGSNSQLSHHQPPSRRSP